MSTYKYRMNAFSFLEDACDISSFKKVGVHFISTTTYIIRVVCNSAVCNKKKLTDILEKSWNKMSMKMSTIKCNINVLIIEEGFFIND